MEHNRGKGDSSNGGEKKDDNVEMMWRTGVAKGPCVMNKNVTF